MTNDVSNNRTSVLIKSQVPTFVRDEHERFVEFIEYYYKFLEQDGETLYVTKHFPTYLDIDKITEDIRSDGHSENGDYHIFLQKLYDNFTTLIPDSILADKTMLLKHAKDFYRSRGSEKSIRFLMRALYDSDAEFYYPKRDILRASDGKWFIEKSLNVRDFAVNNVANSSAFSMFVNREIRGSVSNSTCTVESAVQNYDNGVLVTELKVSNVEQDFKNGEEIFTFFEENGQVKRLSCNLYSGIISAVRVTKGGAEYTQGASVPVEPSDNGSGGIVIISKVAKARLEGKIKAVNVVLPGAGFRIGDNVLFTGGAGGKGAAANISIVNLDETYHPSNFDIVGSRIIDVANTQIANTTDPNEGFAYSNLANIYVNTSNLTVSTIPGSFITELQLSGTMETSNVYFETGDFVRVDNTYLRIIESDRYGSTLYVSSPGIPGNKSNLPLTIYKKPNSNSIMSLSMHYWTYDNCGPIQAVAVTSEGSGYLELPTLDVRANSFVRSLGILGKMEINDGGVGYANGDILQFVNRYGDYGEGANGLVTVVDSNGTIQQVAFYPHPGYTTGGSGYSMASLPDVIVLSSNTQAYGANIQVTAVIGDGELIEAKSNVIGSIQELKILSGGSGYETAPTLNLQSQGDGTAQAYANIVTGIFTYPGRYINDDGHISGYNFIQDRDYYQPYSYVIKSDVALEKYRKSIKELSHPAGMKLFGQHVYKSMMANVASANVMNSSIMFSNNWANVVISYSTSNSLSYIPSGNYANLTFDKRTGTSNTFANLGSVIYDTQNIWYNAANTSQKANVRGNTYFTAGGLRFQGIYSGGNVTMSHAASLNVSNVMTVVAWINQSNTSAYKTILSKINPTDSRGFELSMYEGNPIVYLRPGTSNNILTITTGLQSNVWQFVAFSYDGNKIRGYSNGKFISISTGTANGATDTSNNLIIGARSGSTANIFEGKIASVEIYNKVLSNNDIEILFNKTKRRFGI